MENSQASYAQIDESESFFDHIANEEITIAGYTGIVKDLIELCPVKGDDSRMTKEAIDAFAVKAWVASGNELPSKFSYLIQSKSEDVPKENEDNDVRVNSVIEKTDNSNSSAKVKDQYTTLDAPKWIEETVLNNEDDVEAIDQTRSIDKVEEADLAEFKVNSVQAIEEPTQSPKVIRLGTPLVERESKITEVVISSSEQRKVDKEDSIEDVDELVFEELVEEKNISLNEVITVDSVVKPTEEITPSSFTVLPESREVISDENSSELSLGLDQIKTLPIESLDFRLNSPEIEMGLESNLGSPFRNLLESMAGNIDDEADFVIVQALNFNVEKVSHENLLLAEKVYDQVEEIITRIDLLDIPDDLNIKNVDNLLDEETVNKLEQLISEILLILDIDLSEEESARLVKMIVISKLKSELVKRDLEDKFEQGTHEFKVGISSTLTNIQVRSYSDTIFAVLGKFALS